MKLSLFPAMLAAAVAASPAAAQQSAGRDVRPNVILLMADDLGWGDVGYHGHPNKLTPHLDEMAAAGLRLERFYSAAPVCSPTRGSCLTGRHPFRYGVFGANVGHLPDEEITLAEILSEQGYATGHFGKWHLGTLTTEVKDSNRGGSGGKEHFSPPWRNGFEVCFSTEAKVPTFDPLWRPKSAKGNTWWDPVKNARDAAAYGTRYWTSSGEAEGELRGDDSRLILDRAVPFIREAAAADRPFLAVIWLHAPHLPVVAGPEHTERFADLDGHTRHYYGCIAALDEQVGRLRRELRELGIEKDTLLWFASDNGPEGGDGSPGKTGGLRGRKRSLFEGGVRVPGIVEWPGTIEAGENEIPAVTSDYLPTILELLKVDPPGRPLDGVSLLPLLKGEMKERPRPIAFESAGQLALIDNRYKIIRPGKSGKRPADDAIDAGHFLLFDLKEDAAESRDLAADHPEIVTRLSAQLADWRASCRASREGQDYQRQSDR